MEHNLRAIFEGGMLRPLEPLDLNEHELVLISISRVAPEVAPRDDEEVRRQRAGLKRMLDQTASLPDEGPDDGLTNRDHDRILYGEPQ